MTRYISLLCGLLFGLGLAISGMINPAKVIGFLDITGAWDPSLALVMGGALCITFPAFHWILKRPQPLFADGFRLPTKSDMDGRLLGGASLFGIGWGLGGFCPGPAIAALAFLDYRVFIVVIAMIIGHLAALFIDRSGQHLASET